MDETISDNIPRNEKPLIAIIGIRDCSRVSFSHELDIPFFIRKVATIMFAISTQVPLLNNFPLTEGSQVVLLRKYQNMLLPAEFAMANLFASLLRLATAPNACRSLLFTFAHNVSNVMRGRRLSLRHSVKHYETVIIFVIASNIYSRCKNT